jgi:hypothetical protein
MEFFSSTRIRKSLFLYPWIRKSPVLKCHDPQMSDPQMPGPQKSGPQMLNPQIARHV